MAKITSEKLNDGQEELSSVELYRAVISMLPEDMKISDSKIKADSYSPYIENALTLWNEVKRRTKEASEAEVIVEQSLKDEFGHCPPWPEGKDEISFSEFKTLLKKVDYDSGFKSVLTTYFYFNLARPDLLKIWFSFDGKENRPKRLDQISVVNKRILESLYDGSIPDKFSEIIKVHCYLKSLHPSDFLYDSELTNDKLLEKAESELKKLKDNPISFKQYSNISEHIFFMARYQALALAHFKAKKGGEAKNRKRTK